MQWLIAAGLLPDRCSSRLGRISAWGELIGYIARRVLPLPLLLLMLPPLPLPPLLLLLLLLLLAVPVRTSRSANHTSLPAKGCGC